MEQSKHTPDSISNPVSCIKVNGVKILPPLLNDKEREEMRLYRILAMQVERRKFNKTESYFSETSPTESIENYSTSSLSSLSMDTSMTSAVNFSEDCSNDVINLLPERRCISETISTVSVPLECDTRNVNESEMYLTVSNQLAHTIQAKEVFPDDIIHKYTNVNNILIPEHDKNVDNDFKANEILQKPTNNNDVQIPERDKTVENDGTNSSNEITNEILQIYINDNSVQIAEVDETIENNTIVNLREITDGYVTANENVDSSGNETPKLVRSRSFTLDKPSPFLLAQLELEEMNATPKPKRKTWNMTNTPDILPNWTPFILPAESEMSSIDDSNNNFCTERSVNSEISNDINIDLNNDNNNELRNNIDDIQVPNLESATKEEFQDYIFKLLQIIEKQNCEIHMLKSLTLNSINNNDIEVTSVLKIEEPKSEPKKCIRQLFPTKEQIWASTIINAGARGYLLRRLFRTERVQLSIQIIKDSLICAMELHNENLSEIHPADIELHRRLIQQVTAACSEFHDIFFKLTIKEKMDLIALDRQRKKDKLLRASSSKSPTLTRITANSSRSPSITETVSTSSLSRTKTRQIEKKIKRDNSIRSCHSADSVRGRKTRSIEKLDLIKISERPVSSKQNMMRKPDSDKKVPWR